MKLKNGNLALTLHSLHMTVEVYIVSKSQQTVRICSREGCVWSSLERLLCLCLCFKRPLCQVGFQMTHRNLGLNLHVNDAKPQKYINLTDHFSVTFMLLMCHGVAAENAHRSQKLNVHFSWQTGFRATVQKSLSRNSCFDS